MIVPLAEQTNRASDGWICVLLRQEHPKKMWPHFWGHVFKEAERRDVREDEFARHRPEGGVSGVVENSKE